MFEWNECNTDQLKELWLAGESGACIGASLGTSRNAVIGKAHRMGLKKPKVIVSVMPRKKRDRAIARRIPKRTTQHARPDAPPLDNFEPVCVHLLDLNESHCRAIVGTADDGLALYCGHVKDSYLYRGYAGSYCAHHGSLYYNRNYGSYRASVSTFPK